MRNQYNIIYAVSEENIFALDKNNSLPWKCNQDMEHFKNLTLDSIVVMGRTTFESLPFKKGLPRRTNIIITSLNINEMLTFDSIKNCIDYIEDNFVDRKVFFIGGIRIIKEVVEKHCNILSTIYKSVIKEHCMSKGNELVAKLYLDLDLGNDTLVKRTLEEYEDYDLHKFCFKY